MSNNWHDVQLAWVKWNRDGIGKDRSGNRDSTYHYIKNVIFSENAPWQRAIIKPNGEMVRIILNQMATDHGVGKPSTNNEIGKMSWIHVPEIGIYSRFDGDQMDVLELHGRLQYLFLMNVSSYFEEQIDDRKATFLIQHGDRLLNQLQKHYDRWTFYSKTFNLNWPELPRRYYNDAYAHMHKQIDIYQDPETAAKRKRQAARSKARAAARKAFDLDS